MEWAVLTAGFVGNRLVLVDLNLDTLPRLESRDVDRRQHLFEKVGLVVALQSVVEGVQVGSSDDVIQHDGLQVDSVECWP